MPNGSRMSLIPIPARKRTLEALEQVQILLALRCAIWAS